MKRRPLLRGTLLLAGFLVLSARAMAGLYCETETRTGILSKRRPDVMHTRIWVDGERGKVLFEARAKDSPLGNGNYLLTRDGGATVYLVNPKEKTYAPFSIGKALGTLGSLSRASGGMISITLSNGYGEIMGDAPGKPILGHTTHNIVVRHGFTLTTTMLGRKSVRKMDTRTEAWVAPDLEDAALSIWLRKGPPKTGDPEMDGALRAAVIPLDGFPLKTISVTTTTDEKGREKVDQTEMDVTVLRNESMPASLFQLPAGYRQVSLMESGSGEAGSHEGGASQSENPMKALKGLFGGK